MTNRLVYTAILVPSGAGDVVGDVVGEVVGEVAGEGVGEVVGLVELVGPVVGGSTVAPGGGSEVGVVKSVVYVYK